MAQTGPATGCEPRVTENTQRPAVAVEIVQRQHPSGLGAVPAALDQGPQFALQRQYPKVAILVPIRVQGPVGSRHWSGPRWSSPGRRFHPCASASGTRTERGFAGTPAGRATALPPLRCRCFRHARCRFPGAPPLQLDGFLALTGTRILAVLPSFVIVGDPPDGTALKSSPITLHVLPVGGGGEAILDARCSAIHSSRPLTENRHSLPTRIPKGRLSMRPQAPLEALGPSPLSHPPRSAEPAPALVPTPTADPPGHPKATCWRATAVAGRSVRTIRQATSSCPASPAP